jgi:L,D-peptidoglycan transpeptidase YkuD (ErfK/YbiS/YcfS/YnhG family)
VRAWLRWAAAGIVALGLLPLLGVEPVTRPAAGAPLTRDVPATAAAGTAPVRIRVDDAPSASPSPSPSASLSPSPISPAVKPGPTRPPATNAAAPPPPTNAASRLHTIPSGTRQLIVVTTDGYGTSIATIETFNKVSGAWQPAFAAMGGFIGSEGFSDDHVEGDPTTPTGVYSIGGTMYGIDSNPGVRYGYHQLVPDDYWDENPASPAYNSFVHGADPGAGSEALWQISPQYNYFALIDYNIPVVPANPSRGSAIFLHVINTGGTAGCVALPQSDLVRVLDWLDPAASPRIVMAPSQNLGRY